MKYKVFYLKVALVLLLITLTILCGCGSKPPQSTPLTLVQRVDVVEAKVNQIGDLSERVAQIDAKYGEGNNSSPVALEQFIFNKTKQGVKVDFPNGGKGIVAFRVYAVLDSPITAGQTYESALHYIYSNPIKTGSFTPELRYINNNWCLSAFSFLSEPVALSKKSTTIPIDVVFPYKLYVEVLYYVM